jgi:lipid II:glycine glycyltransferase (peptidoglycan interpeptide bridge formation enzyme)
MSTPALSLPLTPARGWEAVRSRAEWDQLFRQAPRPHFTQAWCYGEGKRLEGWQVERLVFRDDAGPAALCQLLIRRPLGLPVARLNRGPVFLGHEDHERQLAVWRALRRRWRFGTRGLLLLAPGLHADAAHDTLLRKAGFWRRHDRGWTSSRLDLLLPLEELHRRLAADWRTKIRRATRLGVTLRVRRDPAALDWLLERHVDHMNTRGFVGPSPDFVRAVWRAAPQDFWVLQAMVSGEPEAGLLVGRFGPHAENFIAWSSEAGRRATAGNFLMWNAVLEMQRAGCRSLDLGGHSISDRYGHFKRGMRGEEYRLAGEWLAF